ncbi:uncharacterized protein LOC144609591 [Rhinoraja longicauda]
MLLWFADWFGEMEKAAIVSDELVLALCHSRVDLGPDWWSLVGLTAPPLWTSGSSLPACRAVNNWFGEMEKAAIVSDELVLALCHSRVDLGPDWWSLVGLTAPPLWTSGSSLPACRAVNSPLHCQSEAKHKLEEQHLIFRLNSSQPRGRKRRPRCPQWRSSQAHKTPPVRPQIHTGMAESKDQLV